MEQTITPEQKRMDSLIRSTIDLWVKLENQHEGFTVYSYTKEFKKLESLVDRFYKENKLNDFVQVISKMRDHLLTSLTKFTQMELLNG